MRAPLAATLALLAILAACNKDPPPKPTTDEGKKSALPPPSGMVFNDFLPSGGSETGLSVRGDGGLEAGIGEAVGAGASAPDSGENPQEAAARKLKVTSPGAEPRAARKYTFVANRTDKRSITMRQGLGPGQENTFVVLVELTPKQVKPTGARFEVKVLKVEVPDVPPAQKAQFGAQLSALSGLTGTFDVSSHGEIGEVQFKANDERLQGSQLAQVFAQGLQQTLELVMPPLPDEPVGAGATWERSADREEEGVQMKGKHTFTLKDVTAEGGTITSQIAMQVPKRAVSVRGAPPGTMIEVKQTGNYTYAFRFDRVATKVEGDLSIAQNIEIPGKPPQAQTIKLKHVVEVAK